MDLVRNINLLSTTTRTKKQAIVFGAISILALSFPTYVAAKRVLPRAQTALPSTSGTLTRGNISTAVKFRSDRNAIVVTFSNLQDARSIIYRFSYTSGGTRQGVNGTITDVSVDPTSRELLFGTCSNNVCTYDTDVTNAELVVTTTLKNGTRIVKPYKLLR